MASKTQCPDIGKLKRMVADGQSRSHLCEAFGFSHKVIDRWLRENGLKVTRGTGNVFTSQHKTWQDTNTQEKIDRYATPRAIERFWSKVKVGEPDECWEWQAGLSSYGYGSFYFAKGNHRAHRVAWMLTNGPIPVDLHIMHQCDNRKCCNPSHIKVGTIQENLRHREKYGVRVTGMNHGRRRKLDDKAVWKIRAANGTYSEIGRRFGIDASYARAIKLRKAWRELPERPV